MVALVAKKKAKPTAFGVRLRELREAAGLSLAELGVVIGTDRQAIYKLETSPSANPTLSTLQALAAALDVSTSDLLPPSTPEAD